MALGWVSAGISAYNALFNSGGGGGESAAGMADPFGSHRGYYANLLDQMYGAPGSGGGTFDQAGYDKAMADWRANIRHNPLMALRGGGPGMPNKADFYTQNSNAMLNMFRNTPGYQFNQQEAMRGVTRGAAASGGLGSGKMFAELQARSQGLADQTYTSEMNRLMSLAGVTTGQPGVAGQIAQNAAQYNSDRQAANMLGMSKAIGYALNQPNTPDNYSGIAGVNRGSQQDTMLADQWTG